MAKLGTGIDIGEHSFKIVQGRFKGELFQVTRARHVRIADGGDVLAQLPSALQSLGIKGSGLLGLTGKDVIIRYTQVPPVTPQRLKTLMEFEVNEIIQQSGGDVVADYALLPLDEGSDEEDLVLLGLVKDRFLADRMDALKKGGIAVEGATPNAVALFNSFLKNGEFRSEEVTLLLNIGAENCDIALQKNAQLVFARNQSIGGDTFTQAIADGLGVDRERAEKLKILKADLSALLPGARPDQDTERLARTLVGPAGRLFSTVQSTVTFAKNQSKIYNLQLGRVLISGGGARLRGLDAYLQNNLNVPVEYFDPTSAIDTSVLKEDDQRDLAGHGPEMAVAVGLAQMAVDPRFFRVTLLPEKLRKLAEFKRSTAFMIAAGVCLAAFMGVSWMSAKAEHAASEEDRTRIERERRSRQRRTTRYEELAASNAVLAEKTELLAKRRNLGPALVKAWRVVLEHLPSEFWIQDLDIELRPYRDANEPTERATPFSRRGQEEAIGPDLPVVIVNGAAEARGRKLVGVLNEYVARLEEADVIKKVVRKEKHGSGALEFTLHLYMVEPPSLAKKDEGTEEDRS